MASYKKIGDKQQNLYNKEQIKLLEQYFSEYSLMNHYQLWVDAKLSGNKPPNGLNWKIFFNPLLKYFRKK